MISTNIILSSFPLGLPDARVSPRQAALRGAVVIRSVSMSLGVALGCVIGMTPLLFIDTRRKEREAKKKRTRVVKRVS